MRSARECIPKHCQCGRKLPPVQYGHLFNLQGDVHYVVCKCHITYVWTWHPQSNGCWKIRSDMPLFDTREVVVIA